MIIQIGAILAVVLLYWRRLIDVAKGLVGRSVTGRRTLSVSAIAFVPPGVIAQALEGTIEKHLLAVGPVVGAWIVGGVAILLIVRWPCNRTHGFGLEALTNRQALIKREG